MMGASTSSEVSIACSFCSTTIGVRSRNSKEANDWSGLKRRYLVPYAELPEEQKVKDDLFSAIVHVFIH